MKRDEEIEIHRNSNSFQNFDEWYKPLEIIRIT